MAVIILLLINKSDIDLIEQFSLYLDQLSEICDEMVSCEFMFYY